MEALEDVVGLCLGNAGALVADAQRDLVSGRRGSEANRPTGRPELERVRGEVGQHLVDPIRVHDQLQL